MQQFATIFFFAIQLLFTSRIDKNDLLTLVNSFDVVRDYEKPHRQPIPRRPEVVDVIVSAALETENPVQYAIWLDVFGAHESAYQIFLVGDHHDGIGRACGAWQTLCDKTPGFTRCTAEEALTTKCRWGWMFHPRVGLALDQARVAIGDLRQWSMKCDHPVWGYASGTCAQSNTARLYELDVDAEVSTASTFLAH